MARSPRYGDVLRQPRSGVTVMFVARLGYPVWEAVLLDLSGGPAVDGDGEPFLVGQTIRFRLTMPSELTLIESD